MNDQPEQPTSGGRPGVRLNRYMAQCGLGSRRAVERLIVAGHVYVNGEKVRTLGTVVDPEHDQVEYRGQKLVAVRPLEHYAYHKPAGPVVTRFDPNESRTIYSELASSTGRSMEHLKYVGRLDRESEGLLLLTSDGSLVHALTHPRFHVKKVYLAWVSRALTAEGARRLEQEGVESEGQVLRAGSVRSAQGPAGEAGIWYEVVLFEGKKRQVRRLFEALGVSIRRLVRTQFGSVRLGDLAPGAIRPLTERELGGLRNTGYPLQSR